MARPGWINHVPRCVDNLTGKLDMKIQMCRRLSVVEARTGVNQRPRTRMWSGEVEANIDRIMAMPDSADFRMGMWGQVFDKDWRLID